jgi:large repetitive protein
MIFNFKHIPNTEGHKMDHNSIENKGRALLRLSAQKIRRSETSKFRRISAGTMAMAIAAAQIVPAFATIDNTVTASGSGPGGVGVSGTANAQVSVIPAAPGVAVVKSIVFATPGGDANGNGKADPGDVLNYKFTVTNAGNVTLKNVTVADANDGVGAAVAVVVPTAVTTDNGTAAAGTLNDSTNASTTKWDKLGPGDVITFTGSYTVVAGDLNAAGGGTGTGATGNAEPDGYLDDKATVNADYINGATTTSVTASDKKSIQLNIAPGMLVTKTADKTANVIAGDVITYTYTVKNNGNTPITGITLADTHNGIPSGAPGALTPAFQSFNTGATSTHTGNTITLLQPGDVATYTATYTVTQTDVDTRQ